MATAAAAAAAVSSPVSSSLIIKTPLRVSTMTVTANWGQAINLDTVFEQIHSHLIPIWYPDEGILKYEHKGQVLGVGHKDLFTNRKITPKSFFNQSTVVLRKLVPSDQIPQPTSSNQFIVRGQPFYKEVNIKLFANGGIQLTGVTSKQFAIDSVMFLLKIIQGLPTSPFSSPMPISLQKICVPLINTDFSISTNINQDSLHKIFINEYNLFSMLEKTIYQGVNTKFFYNKQSTEPGVCTCKTHCKGQGSGDGEGECKRITMSLFRTGTIIITGAREMEQIMAAYDFLIRVFKKHCSTVLVQQAQRVSAK